ncbi:uncharacterized protein BO80DRAFT_429997 [Aspergillus ibericus CBS 121593]|uniref:Uncharacterized protein n=1 Tax=Aspergillus ibericus CBS 121593 TaxID=1448316 RepID=A0A395GIL3_9EURO|nr:hypothetical protein BO80DRAFT_429997 [Aspergillus ibericus CBS 121593]RAK95285.1 hypothetical protein BO80DRAFT_429997 [Aspergillus ibericus CBS 121593]
MHCLPLLPCLIVFTSWAAIALAIGPPPVQNANHIFNTIHASMRQWGSSLHHNGMSFFLASVPQGTKLYHGDSRSDTISDIGWMAFDPEHAMVFARPSSKAPRIQSTESGSQQVMAASEKDEAGWLHTYVTTNDLQLVYIDGTSAGKSHIGTLDLQDRVLFEDKLESGGVTQETQRARAACQIAQEEWDGRIDGVIRMAAGFEIILCHPEQMLEPVHIGRAKFSSGNKGKQGGKPGELLRSVTSRYHGIGGDRVIVNYDAFVTAYDYDLDLVPLGSKLPRLEHLPASSLAPIRDNLTELIMTHDATDRLVNWQTVADMVVEKYGRTLRSLTSGYHDHVAPLQSITKEVQRILSPFIDYDNEDIEGELGQCSTQFLPAHAPKDSLSYRSVYTVTRRICSSLVEVSQAEDHHTATNILHDLMDYLDWTIWKECHGCHDDEFCAIPIWPQGTQEDYDHPHCQKFDNAYEGVNDYWGPVWR